MPTAIPLSGGSVGSFSTADASTQEAALEAMAEMVAESTAHPTVRNAALAIVRDCDARNDECELEALFNGVKYGTPRVAGLSKGLKYVSDPRWRDYYVAAERTLQLLASKQSINGGDCDDHAMLCASLAGSIGFRVGLRAWGPKGSGNFEHVYAVVLLPKDGTDDEPSTVYGLDTSADVGDSHPGWEPPDGRVVTAWLQDDED